MPLRFTPLGVRQLVQFYDPNNVTNTFSPQINPKSITITPSSVRKYTRTTNGTSVIIGDREYPPAEIRLTWDQLDYADYQALRQYTIISPIVYVDNNDNGFLGCLVIDTAAQVPGMTSNVWGISASFLVISPYNGSHTTLNSIAPPTLTLSQVANGYIATAQTLYVWSTVFSPWGESLTSAVASLTTNAGNAAINVAFTYPTNVYAKKVRLYWNSTNNFNSSTMLTEIQAGFSAAFTIWGPYVGYTLVNPPLINTAFSGYWAGGNFQTV